MMTDTQDKPHREADPGETDSEPATADTEPGFDPTPVVNEVCKQARQDGAQMAGASLGVAIADSPDKWNDPRLRELRDSIRGTCPSHYDGIRAGVVEAGQQLQGNR